METAISRSIAEAREADMFSPRLVQWPGAHKPYRYCTPQVQRPQFSLCLFLETLRVLNHLSDGPDMTPGGSNIPNQYRRSSTSSTPCASFLAPVSRFNSSSFKIYPWMFPLAAGGCALSSPHRLSRPCVHEIQHKQLHDFESVAGFEHAA